VIIALGNSKGGCGKSTLAVHLAGHLAEQDRQIILVDCDPQRSASIWCSEAAPRVGITHAATPSELLTALGPADDDGCYAVIDGAGTSTDMHRAAMLASDLVVLPTGPGVLDLRGVTAATALLQQARQQVERVRGIAGLPGAVIVLNRDQPRHRVPQAARTALHELEPALARQALSYRQAYAQAPASGALVWQLEHDPLAGAEMRGLVVELVAAAQACARRRRAGSASAVTPRPGAVASGQPARW